jgi:hypothetical protein
MPHYQLEQSPVKGGDKDEDENPSVRLQVLVGDPHALSPKL